MIDFKTAHPKEVHLHQPHLHQPLLCSQPYKVLRRHFSVHSHNCCFNIDQSKEQFSKEIFINSKRFNFHKGELLSLVFMQLD